MESALQRRANQGFCAQPSLSKCHKKTLVVRARPELLQAPLHHRKNSRTYHKNAGLSCEARAASSTSAQKNGRTPKDALRGTCQDRANSRDAKGSNHAMEGALQRRAKVLSAAPRVYLQRSSPPPKKNTCRGPLCRPKSIPAEVLSSHPR